MATIEELEERVGDLTDKLRAAKRELKEAQIATAPFQPGDIVTARVRGIWKRARVVSVSPNYGNRFYYRVVGMNADGQWSVATTEVYGQVRALDHES